MALILKGAGKTVRLQTSSVKPAGNTPAPEAGNPSLTKLNEEEKSVAPPSPIETTTDANALKKWKAVPAPGARARLCSFCGQHYLVPCSEAEAVGCANYEYARKFGKKRNDEADGDAGL